MTIVDRSLIGANLEVAGYVTIADRAGKAWTVYVVRPNEPRSPGVNLTSSYSIAVYVGRLSRIVRRDRRWNVELAEGVADPTDRRTASVHSVEPTRTDAVTRATELASSVQERGPDAISS
jgi:hypothetical protein